MVRLVPDTEICFTSENENDLVVRGPRMQGVATVFNYRCICSDELAVAQEHAFNRVSGGRRISLHRPQRVVQIRKSAHDSSFDRQLTNQAEKREAAFSSRWLEHWFTLAYLLAGYLARLLSFVELVRPAQESAGRSQACNQTSRPLTRIRSGHRQVFRAGL